MSEEMKGPEKLTDKKRLLEMLKDEKYYDHIVAESERFPLSCTFNKIPYHICFMGKDDVDEWIATLTRKIAQEEQEETEFSVERRIVVSKDGKHCGDACFGRDVCDGGEIIHCLLFDDYPDGPRQNERVKECLEYGIGE